MRYEMMSQISVLCTHIYKLYYIYTIDIAMQNLKTNTRYTHLECHECHTIFNKQDLHSYCHACNQPLVACYDLAKGEGKNEILYVNSLWRYASLLPIEHSENIVTLGEGFTPILPLEGISKKLGFTKTIRMKDEGHNPTGSFKARGMSVAISKAKELGITQCCTPTAGNAGSALAAYAAKAGMTSKIYMPKLTPKMFQYDCALMGAEVVLVEGSIRDAGMKMAEDNKHVNAWDVSTLKEPFRLEGKKTLGYEIAEQGNWKLPDVIFYPTGGGTGLIGIWKAFQEMKALGWIDEINTRMVAVQMDGCDPIIRAFEAKANASQLCEEPMPTAANGLRVPKAFGDKLILKAIYESNGCAIRVSEDAMLDALQYTAKTEGHFLSPEGSALIAAMHIARDQNQIDASENVMIINTGSGYKYVENLW